MRVPGRHSDHPTAVIRARHTRRPRTRATDLRRLHRRTALL